MMILNEPTGKALGLPGTQEDQVCEGNTDSLKLGSLVSEGVSPAISLAVSHASDRELLKTEIESSNQSSNKSGSNSSTKPNCYECKHRRSVVYSSHSSCEHPIFKATEPAGDLLAALYMMKGLKSPFEKRLNVNYSEHGYRNGWFFWPLNFDPVWLESCDGFEQPTPQAERLEGNDGN